MAYPNAKKSLREWFQAKVDGKNPEEVTGMTEEEARATFAEYIGATDDDD